MDHRGILIAIEQNGYSQTNKVVELLNTRLQNIGYQTKKLSFPDSNKSAGYYVSQYQAGKYGNLEKSNTYIAALLYAMEHFDASQSLQQSLADNQIVIVRGFVGANLHRFGHHFSEAGQRRGFYIWLDDLEHTLMKVPRPDKTYLLSTNPKGKQINKYDEISQLFPKDFTLVDCMRDEKELDPQLVEDILWKIMSASQISPNKEQPPSKSSATAKQAPPQGQSRLGLSGSMDQVLENSASTFYIPKFVKDENRVTYSQGLLKLNKLQRSLTNNLAKQLEKSHSPEIAMQKAKQATWQVHPIAEITKTDLFGRGNLTSGVSKKILSSLGESGRGYGNDSVVAKLQKHSPSNELEMLSDLLYSTSNVSSDDLKLSIEKLSFEKKNKLMAESLLEIKNGGLSNLEKVSFNYTWEHLTSYGAFRYINSIVRDAHTLHQPLSPRYGYDTPEIIDNDALNDDYEECFAESLKIFSELQVKGLEHEAQYLTLLGHKSHWTMRVNLFSFIQLMELLKDPAEAELKNLRRQIIEEVSPTQPLITEYLLS